MLSKLKISPLSWLISLALAGLIFIIVRPTLADIAEERAALAEYVETNTVEVESEVRDGYQHVYYVYDGQKHFITDGNTNNYAAVADGPYVAWVEEVNGAGQIRLYHVLTETVTQLTQSGTNLKPDVSGGRVVWEGWVGDRWQIFLFDDLRVQQLTEGDSAVNPSIAGERVVFARQGADRQWRAELYSLRSGTIREVGRGITVKHLEVADPDVAPAATASPTASPALASPSPEEEAAPTPSPAPEDPDTVTTDDIIDELNGSPAPSPLPTPSPPVESSEEDSQLTPSPAAASLPLASTPPPAAASGDTQAAD